MENEQASRWYDLSGRVYVVTGGTGALGTGVVKALVGAGASVAALSRKAGSADVLRKEVGERADRVLGVSADVLDRQSLVDAAATISERFGHVDGLVNAAGGNAPSATTNDKNSFFDLPEDGLRQVLDLNLLGTILPCQVFGREMARRGEGVILNFSSMNAFKPLTRVPAYSVAKAGVTNFTAWLAVHMAQNYAPGIRVNAVAPGFFLGDQNRYLLTDEETGDLTPRGQAIIDHTPMGRFGAPEDLSGTVLWLLSPASAFVTGITVPVDGGYSAFGGV